MSTTQNKTNKAVGPVKNTTEEKATKSEAPKSKNPVDAAKEKADIKSKLEKEKPAMNLESTLEVLGNLQLKMRQRKRLLETINNLAEFEIDTGSDEDDLTNGGHFQGCVLKIEDDKRNQFKTINPVVIEAVVLFIKDMCGDKLAEIEATIVLP